MPKELALMGKSTAFFKKPNKNPSKQTYLRKNGKITNPESNARTGCGRRFTHGVLHRRRRGQVFGEMYCSSQFFHVLILIGLAWNSDSNASGI